MAPAQGWHAKSWSVPHFYDRTKPPVPFSSKKNIFLKIQSSRGRVVKALDLKSNGDSPRRFESCRLREHFISFPFIRIESTVLIKISALPQSIESNENILVSWSFVWEWAFVSPDKINITSLMLNTSWACLVHTSCRSESSKFSLVSLDKLWTFHVNDPARQEMACMRLQKKHV